MKAIVNSRELEKELKAISPVIKKNNVLPITSGVLMEFTKNNVKVTGTDIETTAIFTMKCECAKAFDIVIELDDILRVCSSVAEPITIESKETGINIYGDTAVFKFSKLGEAEHFPSVTDEEMNLTVDVDGDFFYSIGCANTCKSKEFLKVNMNMVCLDFKKKDGISIVATDNHLMYLKSIDSKPTKDLNVMIPDSFIQLTKRFQESTVWVGSNWIKAECDNRIVLSRLGEQKFVNYLSFFTDKIDFNFKIDKASLRNALLRTGITSNERTKLCVFSFKKDELIITSQNIDLGKESIDKIYTTHSIEMEDMGLNGSLLLHLLNLIDSEEIELSFSSPTRAVYLRSADDESLTTLLFPMALTNN